MDINKKVFEEIIDSFAANGCLFSCERQFQLELAWALKKKDYETYLEVLDTSENKKYIDIVIKLNEGEYAAIELKYTLRQNNMQYIISNKKTVHTFAQGAGDVRRYDYLKDVQRIEYLLSKKTGLFGFGDIKVTKGYAIIMTNDSYSTKDGKGTKYEEVALNKDRELPINRKICLNVSGYSDREPIVLRKKHTCKWNPFNLSDNTVIKYETDTGNKKEVPYSKYPFEYMILEIE